MPARDHNGDDGVDDTAGGILSTPTGPRKPFRRTAWGLLIAGLVGLVLVVGAGLVVSANSPAAGPGHEATWPAGETMTLYPVPLQGDGDNDVAHCRLRPENETTWRDLDVPVWEPQTPDVSGDAVISCDLAVTVQTGTARSISEITRQGPAIGVPLALAVIGGFLFVPRFVHAMAHVSNPRWVRRLLKLPPPR